MSVAEEDERDPMIIARLHTVLASGADAARLESLHRAARGCLGSGHEVTLLVECSLLYARSPGCPAGEVLDAWADLRERAHGVLPETHTTLMAIRSYYARCLRRRGDPGDLDRVVRLRREEVDLRVRGDAGDNWAGVARADLAVALLERGRFGPLDPRLEEPDAEADLAEARELLERETDRRTAGYGPDNPFTWHSRGILASVLVALAGQAPAPQQRGQFGTEALALADGLIRYQWRRFGLHTRQALRAQVIRAEALSVLDRGADAEREARLASLLTHRYGDLDAGRPLLVLARVLATRDPVAALTAANRALATRRTWLSPHGHQVAEAERVAATFATRPSPVR